MRIIYLVYRAAASEPNVTRASIAYHTVGSFDCLYVEPSESEWFIPGTVDPND